MASIDTILSTVANAALTAVTVATGDSLTVRSFQPGQSAYLDDIVTKCASAATARVTSPFLHDTTRGITTTSAQAPTVRTLNREAAQPLSTQDTLAVSGSAAAAAPVLIALLAYYTDLGASDARLHSWGDISGNIVQIKPVTVVAACSATVGLWADTLITATENLLKANTDYAYLGYVVDVACGVVAVKGQDSGNLRVGGPGSTLSFVTSEYFVDKSNDTGRPYILVINAANANNTFVSVADSVASTSVNVQLQLAELAHNLS